MRIAGYFPHVLAALVWVMLTGCQGPNLSQRISSGRAAYESWSADVQAAISEGRIAVGFTPEQVRMAWGEPDDIAMEISTEAETERWVYLKKTPALSFGFGVGNYGRSGGVSTSVGTTVGGGTNVVALARFKNGLVESFDRQK